MKKTSLLIVFVLFIFLFVTVELEMFSSQKTGKIVYSTRGTGFKIWVMDEDGSNRIQLTFGENRDYGPRWSPDGRQIVFASPSPILGYSEGFVMNADGSNVTKIVSLGSNSGGFDWTPDGAKIGFTVNYGSNDNSIYWVNPDGSGLEPIYDAHSKVDFCSFSADGKKILYTHWGKLFIMNLDDNVKTEIGRAQRADWLPNQDLVVYVDLSTYRDIWLVNPATLERTQLTFEYPRQEHFLDPEWSWPDAQKIVYNRAGDLWIMNSDGSNKIQLTFDGTGGEGSGELYYFEEDSPPTVSASGGGEYEINTPVTLGGTISDFDGDLIDYQWLEGNTVLFSGSVPTIYGGTPAPLPEHILTGLSLGTHSLTIQVSDGVNDPVSDTIGVTIVDTIPPVLAPVADKTTLWPPNHKMVDIVVTANASDNSGLPVTLSAVISSNEPESTGKGDKAPDRTEPQIDQENGIISFQLRAERLGGGNGRVYTITVTAADTSGNQSSENVVVMVPHDKGKK